MSEPDQLLDRLKKEIAKRGLGASKAMALALGLHPTAVNTWSKDNHIPLGRRMQVEAWIAGQPIPEPLHVRAKRQDVPRVVAKLPGPAPVAPEPQKAAESTASAILAALSGVAVRGWVVVDGEMVERRVVVVG